MLNPSKGAQENDLAAITIPWTRLPLRFDAGLLRAEVQAIAEAAWVPHFNQADYEGRWSSVALRSKSGRVDDITAQGSIEEFRDTPLAAQCPHLQAVMAAFAFPQKSVRLLRLHAGSRVREHRDADLGLADGELRIHVPVVTSEQVEFVVANRRLMLREGEAWYIDFSQPHRIDNRGASDRIHLILDGTLNEWAAALLQRSVEEIVTETFEPAGAAGFRVFREMVFEDLQLQEEMLRAAERPRFLQAVVAAGAERGYGFGMAEVESILNQRRREWMERSVGA
jgi:hypothetical protein